MLPDGDLTEIRRMRRPSNDATEYSDKLHMHQNPFLGVLIVLDQAIDTLQSRDGDKSDIVRELLDIKNKLQSPAQIDMSVLEHDVARLGVLLDGINR